MQRRKTSSGAPGTVDPAEILHFSKDSADWWADRGPFAVLHRLNPVRLAFLRGLLAPSASSNDRPLEGLRLLDIGCGGGLVCEPLARLGARVTGIDADSHAIAAARSHAQEAGLEIDYRCGAAEDLVADEAGSFDAVLALEVAEHAADLDSLVSACAALCRPGGTVVFSTLNRTLKGFLLGIVAAEYVLGWVPKGTHRWKKFVRPHELARAARQAALEIRTQKGLIFNPLSNAFTLSDTDFDVNYLMAFVKTSSDAQESPRSRDRSPGRSARGG